MKKIIAAALSLILGTLGFTIVDKTMEDRVKNLETQVSVQQSVIDELQGYHNKHDYETTTKKGQVTPGNVEITDNTNNPTTETLSVPQGVSAILSAYNAAANRTKAHNNMTIYKTNDVEIVIDYLAGSSTVIANLANSVASSFMKKYNGSGFTEVYVNGKPTKNTTERDLQYTNMLANDKSLFIPVRNKSYMCALTPNDVLSATATKVSETSYKVVIKLKSESTDLNTPPAIITRGMDYFEQKVFDLQGFQFTGGTVNYTNCVITGVVNASGYLDYAENKMSVSSTDAKVSILGLELDGKIHGDYITTLKFAIQ